MNVSPSQLTQYSAEDDKSLLETLNRNDRDNWAWDYTIAKDELKAIGLVGQRDYRTTILRISKILGSDALNDAQRRFLARTSKAREK
jgi:hypothetical protein